MKKCARNFFVAWHNRPLTTGDDFIGWKTYSKNVKACTPKDAVSKAMKGKVGYDIEALETDKLLSSKDDRIKGKVLKITKHGNKLRRK